MLLLLPDRQLVHPTKMIRHRVADQKVANQILVAVQVLAEVAALKVVTVAYMHAAATALGDASSEWSQPAVVPVKVVLEMR